ncbi:peptidyl-tRNA hydrolase ICT1 [Schistosoma bovis]|uniref:Large ribosomal subunit protein mL62 n=1 Tax=Schistosoma bovis TaxID=6184 RepID=A0A430Q416_SCHBO|nr:peptidyl-tRNA hydrolase ICT1 [Schistosoma bovis]
MIRTGKFLLFCISRPSVRCLSSFESAQNPVNLYPNSDPNAVFKKPTEPNELQISYAYSSGPGGQHVNRNKTKVEIRFHVPSASWIPDQVKQLFMEREANRINKENYFIITSDHTRKQILNQADCLERIRRIIRECVNSLNKPEPSPETLEAIQSR